MPSTFVLTDDQRTKEQSILFAISMDTAMFILVVTAAVIGGSLTMLAEALRGSLGYLLECFTFLVLRRIHRGVLVDMEYGSGKLEQVANVMIGASMLIAAGWIGIGVLKIASGQRSIGTPAGLTFAAMVGMLNLYVNVLAWDAVRRAAAANDSLIMSAQLTLRWVKMIASVVVIISLTVAAVSTDEAIVAFADAVGSLFVATYLVIESIAVLRSALPDLLDRSAGERVRETVTRSLTARSADYARINGFRSRRSGRVTFIEIALAFDVALTIAEVNRRIETLKATISEELGEAEISVIATAA
jgi:divalent metal cation (Fe/Co/Zn/Cd) transporter